MPSRDEEIGGSAPPREGVEPSDDALRTAYSRRTLQVHEAHSALGEAVHTMRLELAARREESDSLRAANETLRASNETSHKEVLWQREERARMIAETEELRGRLVRVEQELREAGALIGSFQRMKAVRWTAWPRRIRHRLRARPK